MRASTDQATLARAFLVAASRYWLSVFPTARREIRHWRRRVAAAPDAVLRVLALETLEAKWGNLEGAAAFAAFVPSAWRLTVTRAVVAWQAIYDYADILMEQPCHDHAANAASLHAPLLVAVTPGSRQEDYYARHSCHDDGGYMAAMVEGSRQALLALPGHAAMCDLVQRNAALIVRYQTLIGRPQDFAAWAAALTPDGAHLRWWETGAACGSSVGVFALIAAAADPAASRRDAEVIEAAYFPWIGSLHTLLDSLVDRHEDLLTGQHSLVGHYGPPGAEAERMRALAQEAARRARALPDGMSHALLLAGMVSLYLSSGSASSPDARPAKEGVVAGVGALGGPAMAVLGVRHAMRHLGL